MKLKLPASAIVVFCSIVLFSFYSGPQSSTKKLKFPYKKTGLTDRQAAAHLLNRFTYGATPGQIDEVVNTGLEKWFEQQLDAKLPDDSLNKRLSVYDALAFTNKQAVDIYPEREALYNMAAAAGYVSKDSLYVAKDRRAFNAQIQAFMKLKGYRSNQDLQNQFIDQKILRATYTNNQLQEVLTDFWFNHFNVSYSKNGPQLFIPSYERDVIRPNVFGKFDVILMATAKSPAMLHFLDNFTSVAPAPEMAAVAPPPQMDMMMMGDTTHKTPPVPIRRRRTSGLNENYAREVMELHTLGVDGGYTQSDVTQAARVLTGWTNYPFGDANNRVSQLYIRNGVEGMEKQGFVHQGDFLFNPTSHDKNPKTVLDHQFDGSGYQEGVDLLEMLAHHPSTAKFITRKIAIRFVSDNPPQSLLNKMAKSFTDHDGDIREVLITMVSSPEFWSSQSLREKTKSPFELAISSLRSINADVKQPRQIYNWVSNMGERMYYYLAPTGFPDKGTYWINTGSLLSRMNFGLALASQRIPGVNFNLKALNGNHEPESAEAALNIYSKLFMPERDLNQTIKRLTPLLTQTNLAATINNAATTPTSKPTETINNQDMMMTGGEITVINVNKGLYPGTYTVRNVGNNSMLNQVVGIIIGSPEYQRR
ncbi:DUF1800 domain-containing protein [Mucilaginibacter sp. HMF5004]|uniref:DUF1800 domain-containing protein n=1 Tax=Mucilaginibacter rivuli TaxID=2857527 RepID=UPI001C5CDD5A|nr:DUF1800 domain-containing protein [Mucilaginibacter rivuli]MBW4891492.1 DUF1800 domain-containing protein [Mucilaginibacter rivuli]